MGGGISGMRSEQQMVKHALEFSPLSVALNPATLQQFSQCFEVIKIKPMAEIKNEQLSMDSFFVVAEGQVDVSVKVPNGNKRTSFVMNVLCTKKTGDLLWVPAVQSFAADAATAKELGFRSFGRTASMEILNLFKKKEEGELGIMHGSLNLTRSFQKMKRQVSTMAGYKNLDADEEQAAAEAAAAQRKKEQLKKTMAKMDMTSATAPFGATLLRLDQAKFDQFETEVLPKYTSDPDYARESGLSNIQLDFKLLKVMMKSNIQDYLKRIPFLSKVPRTRLQMLGEMSQFEVFPAGATVCHEGAQGDKVYVIIYGQLEVQSTSLPDPSTGKVVDIVLATLGIGSHFGELSVLADIPRQATVKTKTSALLVSISRSPFRNMMKVVPDLGKTVESVMKLYMLTKFFSSLLYSEKLTKINIEVLQKQLLPTCQLLEVEEDTVLIDEDSQAERFFFLYHGRVSATKLMPPDDNNPTERSIEVGMLAAGNYFGEISILTSTPCRATLKALTRCMMLVVDKSKFQSIWCSIPGFRAEFLVRILGLSCHLEHVLEHDVARRSFESHMTSEFSSEGLKFYYKAYDYWEKYKEREALGNKMMATEIYDKYLSVNAPEQVNIPGTMREAVEAELNSSDGPSATIFSNSRAEAFSMIEKDNFKRYKKTDAFQLLLKSLRAYPNIDLQKVNVHDLMDKSGQTRYSRPTQSQKKRLSVHAIDEAGPILAPRPTFEQQKNLAETQMGLQSPTEEADRMQMLSSGANAEDAMAQVGREPGP